MEGKGYLLLVLNTHMPFVRDSEREYPPEENWLFEAITESYIPLLEVLQGFANDGVEFKLTFSFSPCLLAMLADPLLQARYLGYLDERIRLAKSEIERLDSWAEFRRLACIYLDRFQKRRLFIDELQQKGQGLIEAFRTLMDSGQVEIIASSATHAYLPVWEINSHIVDLQVQAGLKQYQACFGKKPQGFWLPECGYYPSRGRASTSGFHPGLDVILQKAGIKYFFVETHGLTHGQPKPKSDVYAPIHCPSGVAAFGRDWFCHNLVWCKDMGYPGDSFYLDFDRDIGRELDCDYLAPFTHQNRPAPTGIRYFKNKWVNGSDLYEPEAAFARCDEHANDFIFQCQRQVEQLYARLGRKPVLVAMVDTEHLGHWWNEGPAWLNMVIRKLACDQKTVELITAVDYLTMYPTNQVVTPSMSSWGYKGYSEVWLIGKNHWIYPEIYGAIELLDEVAVANRDPQPKVRAALNQYLRELLLAQTSDWAFIMHTGTAREYAEKRVKEHVDNMQRLYQQVSQNSIDAEWLRAIQAKNNIFSNTDLLDLYQASLWQ